MLNQGGSDKSFAIAISGTSFMVQDGDYLAMSLRNDNGNESIMLKLGSDFSYLSSPAYYPAYPVPEMATLVLVSSGLVALAVYLWFWGRRRPVTAG